MLTHLGQCGLNGRGGGGRGLEGGVEGKCARFAETKCCCRCAVLSLPFVYWRCSQAFLLPSPSVPSTHTQKHTHTHTRTHAHSLTHSHTHTHTHIHTNTHTRTHARTHATYTRTHARTRARTHAHTPTPPHTHTLTHTQTNKQANKLVFSPGVTQINFVPFYPRCPNRLITMSVHKDKKWCPHSGFSPGGVRPNEEFGRNFKRRGKFVFFFFFFFSSSFSPASLYPIPILVLIRKWTKLISSPFPLPPRF